MDAHPPRRLSAASLVMMAAMFGVICAMVSSAVAPTTYRATAVAYVDSQGARSGADLQSAAAFSQDAAGSVAQLATTPSVLEPVIERLGLGTSPARLATRVDAERKPDTSVVRVTVADSDAVTAAAVANGVARRLVAVSADLSPKASGAPALHVTQVQRAVAPRSPAGLALPLVVLVGLGSGGGIAALALAIAWALRRRPPSGRGLIAPSML